MTRSVEDFASLKRRDVKPHHKAVFNADYGKCRKSQHKDGKHCPAWMSGAGNCKWCGAK
jgi:hypothetical protein